MALSDSEQDGLGMAPSDVNLQSTHLSACPDSQSVYLTASATTTSQAVPSGSRTRSSSLNSSGPEPQNSPSQQDIELHEIERGSNDIQSVAQSPHGQPGIVVEDRAPSNRTVRCASKDDSCTMLNRVANRVLASLGASFGGSTFSSVHLPCQTSNDC